MPPKQSKPQEFAMTRNEKVAFSAIDAETREVQGQQMQLLARLNQLNDDRVTCAAEARARLALPAEGGELVFNSTTGVYRWTAPEPEDQKKDEPAPAAVAPAPAAPVVTAPAAPAAEAPKS